MEIGKTFSFTFCAVGSSRNDLAGWRLQTARITKIWSEESPLAKLLLYLGMLFCHTHADVTHAFAQAKEVFAVNGLQPAVGAERRRTDACDCQCCLPRGQLVSMAPATAPY